METSEIIFCTKLWLDLSVIGKRTQMNNTSLCSVRLNLFDTVCLEGKSDGKEWSYVPDAFLVSGLSFTTPNSTASTNDMYQSWEKHIFFQALPVWLWYVYFKS